MLEIDDLHVAVEGKKILKGVSLRVLPGQIHAIMGPNGAGKSTLSKVLAGDPSFEVVSGDIRLSGVSLLDKEVDERAHMGLFIGFQYPVEVPGVSNVQFLQTALNAKRKSLSLPLISEQEFVSLLEEKMALLEIKKEFAERNLNEGFSGGEKKRNEILQMALLEPLVAILDETDSGLDIDAMRMVAHGIARLSNQERSLILITHYQRLLDHITPHFVHVMKEGKIVRSGGPELAKQLEEKGYDWI